MSDFHYLFGGQNVEIGVKDGALISRVSGVEIPLSSSSQSTTQAPLRPFRAALADRNQNPCSIYVIGDSTDEGHGAGSTAADRMGSWPNALGTLMRDRFKTVGETNSGPNFVPVVTASPTLPTGWTLTGSWVGVTTGNFGPTALAAKSTAAGDTATYTIPVGCTSIDILGVRGSSIGGYTSQIDGGAASATFFNGAPTQDGATQRITGWSTNATHTLQINTVGTSNQLDGIILYFGNETKGIRVFNGGHFGSYSRLYLPSQTYNWIRLNPQPANSLSGVQSTIPLNPDLIVMALGYNDFANTTNGPVTPTEFLANVQEIVTNARAMLPSKIIPVLYLSKYTPNTVSGSGTNTWQDYVSTMHSAAIADANGVHLDLTNTMPAVGSTEAATLNLYSDTVHGNKKSYQMIADAVASFIAP